MLEGKRPSPSSDLLVASLDEWAIEADRRDGVIARAREMWQYRRVLWFFASRSLKSLYSKTRLGPTWLLIRTLVPLIVGSAVFGGVMKVSTGSVPYFIFLNVSQIPWNCFDGPLVRASRGLDANRQLLTKLYLPRMILPIGQMAAGMIEPVIMTFMLVVSTVYYRIHDGVWYVRPTPRLLLAPLCVLLILAFAFSLSLWTSVWQARARDARFILRYVVGFWMLFTPVVYPLSKVPANVQWLAHLNPITAPVETFKWALLDGMVHSWPWFLYSVAITVAVFFFGAWYFARAESLTVDKL